MMSSVRHSHTLVDDTTQRDRIALFDLVRRERFARDRFQWQRLEECYTDHAQIRVAWFSGNAQEFSAASQRQMSGPSLGRHLMIPMDVQLHGHRAVVESDATISVRLPMDGVDIDVDSHCRFVSCAVRQDQVWRLTSFDCIYIKDAVQAVRTDQVLPIRWHELSTLRPSYRHLTWLLQAAGHDVDPSMAGVDRPDLVRALYRRVEHWLQVGELSPVIAFAS